MVLAAIVVVYEPDADALIENILSYIEDIDKLLIFKNSFIDLSIIKRLQIHSGKIEYLGDGINLGIATALNKGVEWSLHHNYTHILTLDQDSSFPKNQLVRFKDRVKEFDSISVFAVNPDNRGRLTFVSSDSYLIVPDAITSGTIFPLKIFKECGMFEDKLFIDAVDYEFCYRIRKSKGYNTIIFPEIILTHEVGYPKKINFGFTTDNYSAFRTYHIIRNHIIIWKRYPELFQSKYKVTLIKIHIVYRFVKVILGEDNKYPKIKSIVLGIIHGLTNTIKEKV